MHKTDLDIARAAEIAASITVCASEEKVIAALRAYAHPDVISAARRVFREDLDAYYRAEGAVVGAAREEREAALLDTCHIRKDLA